MSRIISKRWTEERVAHSLGFCSADYAQSGHGYGFPCDEHGNVLRSGEDGHGEITWSPEAEANLQRCLAGEDGITPAGVRTHRWTYTHPAVLRCDCGREVELYGFTNTCECGADYNSSGQRLAPRSQWGEETGESLSDILSIP